MTLHLNLPVGSFSSGQLHIPMHLKLMKAKLLSLALTSLVAVPVSILAAAAAPGTRIPD
jgi:hypothetical protein